MTDQRLALSTAPLASHADADYDPIGAAAERLQDLAWTMRERGLDVSTCAQIEELAAAILSASSLRNPAGQRAQRLAEVLRYLEQRLETMLDDGAASANAPSTPAEAPPPADVVPGPDAATAPLGARDVMEEIENELFANVPAPAAPAPAAQPTPQPHPRDPLAALRAMSDEERIALFT
jgi:hypothetical protein